MNEVLTYEALKADRDAQQKRADALAVENVAIKDAIPRLKDIDYSNDSMDDVSLAEDIGFNEAVTQINNMVIKTPATDAALAAIREKYRAEGINFAANRLLAAFEHGFIDKPAGEVSDVAKMILSAVTELPGAAEEDFTRDYSDEVIALIRAELREAK